MSYLTDGVDLRAARLVPERRLDGGIDTGWLTVRDCLTDRQPGLSRARCTTSDSRRTSNSHGITLGEDVPDGVGSGVSPSPALAIFDLRSPQVFGHTRTLPVAGRLRGRLYPTCWIDRQRKTNPPLAGGLPPPSSRIGGRLDVETPSGRSVEVFVSTQRLGAPCSGPSVAFNQHAIGSGQSCCWRTPQNRTSTWCPAPSDGKHPLPSPTGATSGSAARPSTASRSLGHRWPGFSGTPGTRTAGTTISGNPSTHLRWVSVRRRRALRRSATPTTGEPRGSSRSIVRRPCK